MIGKTTVYGSGVTSAPWNRVRNARRGFKRPADVHVRNLRAKIEPAPKNSCHILRTPGIGHKLVVAADAA